MKIKSIFKKPEKTDLAAVVAGVIQPLSMSCDPVFKEKLLGDGFLIQPSGNDIVSCVDGVVTLLYPTMHAIGLQDLDGKEYLIHIGVDTVTLNGEGFEPAVEVGDTVKKGQLLMHVEFAAIQDKVASTDVLVILVSKQSCLVLHPGTTVEQGQQGIVSVN